jgi:predicted XRE-type DNA-binding protein
MATKFPSEKELKEVREILEKGPAARPLPKDASPVDKAKHALCEEFVKYKNMHKLTQRALSERIGIDEALVSKIIHYSFDEFTTDRLIKYLAALYPKVEVKIRVA